MKNSRFRINKVVALLIGAFMVSGFIASGQMNGGFRLSSKTEQNRPLTTVASPSQTEDSTKTEEVTVSDTIIHAVDSLGVQSSLSLPAVDSLGVQSSPVIPAVDSLEAKSSPPSAVSSSTPPEKPQSKESQPEATRSTRKKGERSTVDYSGNRVFKLEKDTITRIVGDVAFHHNGVVIECDSALRYDDLHMDCFGNVRINKDSTYIYGEIARYDGTIDLATVYSSLVKITNGEETVMYANDKLYFNTYTNIGEYSDGGIVEQRDNFMESYRGAYNSDLNEVTLYDSVAMRNNQYELRTDSLRFNLDTEITTFLTTTYIWDKESDFLTSRSGNYNHKIETYTFTEDAYVLSPDYEVWADSMLYISRYKEVFMQRNVQILDTANSTVAFSDWGYYHDSLQLAILSRNPSIRSWDENKDTMYMRADSIYFETFQSGMSKPDSAMLAKLDQESQQERDSISGKQEAESEEAPMIVQPEGESQKEDLYREQINPRLDSLGVDLLDSLGNPIYDTIRTLIPPHQNDDPSAGNFGSTSPPGGSRIGSNKAKSPLASKEDIDQPIHDTLQAPSITADELDNAVSDTLQAPPITAEELDNAVSDTLQDSHSLEPLGDTGDAKPKDQQEPVDKTTLPEDGTLLLDAAIEDNNVDIVADSIKDPLSSSVSPDIKDIDLPVKSDNSNIAETDSSPNTTDTEPLFSTEPSKAIDNPENDTVKIDTTGHAIVEAEDFTPPAKTIFEILETPLLDSLGEPLRDSLGDQLYEAVGTPLLDTLDVALTDSLGVTMYEKISQRLLDSVRIPVRDTLQKAIFSHIHWMALDSLRNPIIDTLTKRQLVAKIYQLELDSLNAPRYDSLGELIYREIEPPTSLASVPEEPKDSLERRIRGFQSVRVYRFDFQMACDSIVGFSIDSTVVLYGSPLMWSENNQVSAQERVDVYTKNEKMDWADFVGAPLVVQEIDTAHYNQAKGRTLKVFFKENEIDFARFEGNVMNYYYYEENEAEDEVYEASTEIVAFMTIESAEQEIFFEEQKMVRMWWNGKPVSDTYPIEKIPADQPQRLDEFKWITQGRATNSQEVSDRIERPSRRVESEGYSKPKFMMEDRIKTYKKELLEKGTWKDREDKVIHTVDFFTGDNDSFLKY